MRPEKADIVSDLSEKLNRSPFVLVTDYQRMNVNHFADLRNRLAASGAEMHVVKNSFLKRAMTDSGLPDVADKLTGQTAVVTGQKDAAPIAKILKVFAAEFKIAALKIGVIDKAILSTEEVEALAELPSREVLLSQLLGLLMSPATKLVRVLNEPASAFARLLNAKASAMPAPEPVKVEPPKAESVSAPAPATEAEIPQAETVSEAPKPEAAEPVKAGVAEGEPAAETKVADAAPASETQETSTEGETAAT
ncbi:MAG: large subunit ribosomal protein [Verrucomicrobiota bacterium]|jgi:large subunit ribosomal protein L10